MADGMHDHELLLARNARRHQCMPAGCRSGAATALLLLLLPLRADAGRSGYHVRFNAPGEILGCKSSLTNITGLQHRGFTVMLWKKSTEIFSGSSNSFFITTASDSNFANLFGDTHPSDFLFSNTDGWPFLPQEEFYNWHHYAVSVNMSSTSSSLHWG